MPDPKHHSIDYIEIPTTDVAASKAFFQQTFGWEFTDYGPDYTSFYDGHVTGGFKSADKSPTVDDGSPLIVIYARELPVTRDAVVKHDGEITEDIFSFPGGRRFHFKDPSGAEFAVWSDDEVEE